jgi:glycosyltransferase involved in cell wall biosynthesis
MRLLFFSHYYPPEVNAPANRTSENCRTWARMGHEVHVVTCFPSHPQGVLYPGWRMRWAYDEVDQGVHVHRVWTYLGANRGVVRRTLNYLSFAPVAVWRALQLGRFDLIVATSPQFFCAVAGWLSARAKRTRWVFELRDLWPDSIVAVGVVRPSFAVRAVEKVELAMYKHASVIVCLTPAFVENLVGRGIERTKLALVPNGVDMEFWGRPADGAGWRVRHGLGDGDFVASYVGTIGMAHGIGTILDAARMLLQRPGIRLLIVGDGAERETLAARAVAEGLPNVCFVGQVPREEVRDVLAASDVALVLLRNQPLFRTVLPSKMFEYLAMGCPIVMGVGGQARSVLEVSGGGVAIPPEDAGALARALCDLAATPDRRRTMGEVGRAFVVREYNRRIWAERYEQILRGVAGVPSQFTVGGGGAR